VLKYIRQNSLTCLRYSVAYEGCQKQKSTSTASSKSTSKAKFECGLGPHDLFYGFDFGVRYAHNAFGFAVDLPTPVHRLDPSQTSGGVRRGLFEHVDAQRIVRVPQPRLFVMDRGNPAGAVNRGSPSFGYFSWRSKKSD
jgi:hypothetical protein